MCPRRSLRQTVLIVEEILAAGGTGARARLCRRPYFFDKRSEGFAVTPSLDRDQPHGRMAVPGQNDLVARFGAAHQLGQLRFGIGYGDFHSGFPLSGSKPASEWL